MDEQRRAAARARLAARRGEPIDPDIEAIDEDEPLPQRSPMGSFRQVSPEMRERYGMGASSGGGRDRYRASSYDDYDDYDEYDDVTWDDGRGSGRFAPQAEMRRAGFGGVGGALSGFAQQVNLPLIIASIVALVLLIAVIVLAANSCSQGQDSQDQAGAASEQTEGEGEGSGSTSESESASSQADVEIDRAALLKILDEETADKLINRAHQSEEARWIAQNPDKYAMDGDAVQAKLLKLAADEPAAYSYVRNFPDKYPMDKPASGTLNIEVTGKNIPKLYQWNELWGYTVYSGTAFGLTGCAPTCMAMVYQGLTGNHDLSPYDMGEIAQRDGYMAEVEGTDASFFLEEAGTFGLQCYMVNGDKESIKQAYTNGAVIVANFGPGIFTQYGHYVVLTGLTTDGQLVMNDPYSEERSNRTWDIQTIIDNSVALYAFSQ